MADSIDMQEIIKGVREYASRPEKYESGWDVIYECWSDEQLIETLQGRVISVRGAINILSRIVRACDDRRRDIQATADEWGWQ